MAQTKAELTKVSGEEKVKVYYTTKKILWGLIKWNVILKEDSMGKDLRIDTAEVYDKILLNGKPLSLSK